MIEAKPAVSTLAWTAPEFEDHQRSPKWYLMFAVITLALVVFAIYTKSLITLILFIIIAIIAFVASMQKPKAIRILLAPTGITVDRAFFPYKRIKSFWLVYNPPGTRLLYFETTDILVNKHRIELADQDPNAVRAYLAAYIPEDLDREEGWDDIIARTLKF